MAQRLVKYQIVCERLQSYQIPSRRIESPEDVYEMAQILGLNKLNQEASYIFCLNSKGDVVGVHNIGVGDVASCSLSPREIFTAAIHTGRTSSIVLVHNHPSGNTHPSDQDIECTRRAIEVGKILGIKVHDHVIIGDEDDKYCSLKSMCCI